MDSEKTGTMIKVWAPASTANLGPGFDSFALALDLYNTVSLGETSTPGELKITITGEGQGSVPCDDTNIAYRAAVALFNKVGYRYRGLKLHQENNIPVGSGLGSSAAAVVGGMTAANLLAGSPLGRNELINMAALLEGHPDNVAAALLGGAVVVAKSDQQGFIARRIDVVLELTCVVAVPDFVLSTRASRKVLPDRVPVADAVFNVGHAALLVLALSTGDLDLLGAAMNDRLHQPYRLPLVPGMEETFAAARAAGAAAVALSGAGPTVIAFTVTNPPGIGRAMQQALGGHGIKSRVMYLRPVGQGVCVLGQAEALEDAYQC